MNSELPCNIRFETTNWSVVLAAGQSSTPESRQALEQLCETYWFPLYAFARRRGKSQNDAKDSIQSFILLLLDRNDFATADPEKGKFRSYLLSALHHFLANEFDYQNAVKRGGGKTTLSIDWGDAESRYSIEPITRDPPEKVFHRQWALSVLQKVLQQLRKEYESAGKLELFATLSRYLIGDHPKMSHDTIAESLSTTSSSVKSSIHRMRKRFREVLRWQVAATVTSEEDINDEIRDLFEALGRN